ncbi:hypothetical protein MMC16_002778 [Acarospora aff. strigata]|nr:hypothetical protein [Acarospora aff. strigata]
MSYLRQPSPLTFEPLIPSPSDLVSLDSESDTDSDSHRAKRRRVEDLGRQYLAGRTLVIQTASLKGPFDDGWVNPWKRDKRHKRRQDSVTEVEPRDGETSTNQDIISVRKGQHTDLNFVAEENPRHRQRVEAGQGQARLQRLDKLSTASKALNFAIEARVNAQEQHKSERQEERRLRKEERARKAALHQQDGLGMTLDRAVDLTEPHERHLPGCTPGTLISTANKWLKSDEAYLQERAQEEPRSPTPTPTSRPDDKPASSRLSPAASTSALTPSRRAHAAFARPTGFTPINKPSLSMLQEECRVGYQWKERTSRSPSGTPTANKGRMASGESYHGTMAEAEPIIEAQVQPTGDPTHEWAWSMAMPEGALNETDQQPESRSSPRHPRGLKSTLPKAPVGIKERSSPHLERVQPTRIKIVSDRAGFPEIHHAPSVGGKIVAAKHISYFTPPTVTRIVQTVPTASHTSDFIYRRPPKRIGNLLPKSGQTTAEPLDVEVKQIQGPSNIDLGPSQESSTRKLVHPSADQVSGNEEDTAQKASLLQHGRGSVDTTSPRLAGKSVASDHEPSVQQSDNTSRISSVLQAAQIVSNAIENVPQATSGPSTDLMETDKQSLYFGTENDDLNAHLSTQAAIAKAQLSFRADLASPIKQSPLVPAGDRDRIISNDNSVSHAVPAKRDISPFRTFRTPTPDSSPDQAPTTTFADENISTQQMIDAVTPFAFSTVKKPRKKRISFTSPSHLSKNRSESDDTDEDFGKSGLDMETSPEGSDQADNGTKLAPKRKQRLSEESSATKSLALPVSFSIAPNGTLKEVFQQDGQVGGEIMDLGAVIDDVGSFLQSWDIEAEVKKSTGPPTNGTTDPGSRSHTGILAGRRRASRPQHHL